MSPIVDRALQVGLGEGAEIAAVLGEEVVREE
jgi:hypothetical protein